MAARPIDGMRVIVGPGLNAGFSGLGALAALTEQGIPIGCVVGANTGALSAAMWAVGADLLEAGRVLAHLEWDDLLVSRDLGSADPLLAALEVLTHRKRFEDCRRDVRILAVDLGTGEGVTLDSGPISLAVRHSMAIPGLIAPLSTGRAILADGGLDRKGLFGAATSQADVRAVVLWPDIPLPPEWDAGPRTSEVIALYALRAWGEPPHIGERCVRVAGPRGSLLDFSRIPDWIESGYRSALDWLGQRSPVGP